MVALKSNYFLKIILQLWYFLSKVTSSPNHSGAVKASASSTEGNSTSAIIRPS